MRAVLVAGSILEDDFVCGLGPEAKEKLGLDWLRSAELIVAVDGGGEVLNRLGLPLSVVVGDMDSISSRTLAQLEQKGVEIVRLPTAKDETDLEAALHLAVSRGAEDITVYGALGGPRLDHLMGNVLLLTSPWLRGIRVRMVDGRHEMFLVGGCVEFTGEKGDLVSLLPLSPRVLDVWTEGLLYPLRGEALVRGETRGVSNEVIAPKAQVRHGEGILLLIHHYLSQDT